MPGWTAEQSTMSAAGPRTVTRPESPGYTPEQAAAKQRLEGRLLELTAAVSTHPFWDTLQGEARVEARMQLKHAHDEDAASAAA
ncbi:hypothetical protein [Streptomyces palmae]